MISDALCVRNYRKDEHCRLTRDLWCAERDSTSRPQLKTSPRPAFFRLRPHSQHSDRRPLMVQYPIRGLLPFEHVVNWHLGVRPPRPLVAIRTFGVSRAWGVLLLLVRSAVHSFCSFSTYTLAFLLLQNRCPRVPFQCLYSLYYMDINADTDVHTYRWHQLPSIAVSNANKAGC
jgi:hypothetical protein